MSTASTATRRHFGSFCLTILYNFPQLLFRDLEPGALLAYTLTIHQCHDWVISDDGSMVTHFDAGMPCDSTSVSSMVECDRSATTSCGIPVHFGAHPRLTRVVHLWTGSSRWRPKRKALIKIMTRRLHFQGLRHRDQRATRSDFRVVSAGTDLVEWKELRHIRGTFSTGLQTLYRLKSNSFPLWNWSRQDLSCPNPVCDRSLTAPASHVFWTCPGSQWHWNHLFSLWQCLGTIDMDRRNIWVFGMGLPGTPNLAWDAVQASLVAPKDISGLRAAIFPAANELWRFVVTSTLHGIWIERLRRMEFPSLPPEAHNASARTQLRRAITSFRNSTYQPGADDATNNLAYMRSALANTLLQNAIPPGLNRLEQDIYPGSFYLLFSMGDREETQGPVVLGLSLLRCIPGLTRHALSGLRAWTTVEHQLRTTMQNIKVCCMV
uniref:Uncharacterized protein n=1 Tax=Hyaloperonospora arabidopsidis (strain Emoy2) TaxID=559515 RepID=M4BQ96_HYAAE